MRDRVTYVWTKCNLQQRRVCLASAGLLIVAFLFPPVYAEQVITGLSDMRGNMVSMAMTDFKGWTFIGHDRLKLFALKTRLKDPDEMTFVERWRAAAGQSLDELRAGPTLKVAYGILTFEIALIALFTGILLYYQRVQSTGGQNRSQIED